MDNVEQLKNNIRSISRDIISSTGRYSLVDITSKKAVTFKNLKVFTKQISKQEIFEIIKNLIKSENLAPVNNSLLIVPKKSFYIDYLENFILDQDDDSYVLDLEKTETILIHGYYDDGYLLFHKYWVAGDGTSPSWVLTYAKKKDLEPSSFKDVYFNY